MQNSASALKRPGGGSRMNWNKFVSNSLGGDSLVDNFILSSRGQARAHGYHDEWSKAAPSNIITAEPATPELSLTVETQHADAAGPAAPKLPLTVDTQHDAAAVAEAPLTSPRLMGSLGIRLLEQSLAKLVPITMRLALKASREGALTATITGVQHGANPALEEEKTLKHMQKLVLRQADEPIAPDSAIHFLLPFAEIAGHQGSQVGMGRPAIAVGGGLVTGIVKALDPDIGMDSPFDVEALPAENGETHITLSNFNLSHEFGGDKEKYWTIVAMKHMQQAGAYIVANEEDQEDLEAKLEELIDEVLVVADGPERKAKMAHLMQEHMTKMRKAREAAAVEEARLAAIAEAHQIRAAKEEAHKKQVAQNAKLVERMNAKSATVSFYGDDGLSYHDRIQKREFNDMLGDLESRLRARQGRTYKQWVKDEYQDEGDSPMAGVDEGDCPMADDDEYDSDEAEEYFEQIATRYDGATTVGQEAELIAGESEETASSAEHSSGVIGEKDPTLPHVQKRKASEDIEEAPAAKKMRVDEAQHVEEVITDEPLSPVDSVVSPPPQIAGQKRKASEDHTSSKKVKGVDGIPQNAPLSSAAPSQDSLSDSTKIVWSGCADCLQFSNDFKCLDIIEPGNSVHVASITLALVTAVVVSNPDATCQVIQGEGTFQLHVGHGEHSLEGFRAAQKILQEAVEANLAKGEQVVEEKAQKERPKMVPQKRAKKVIESASIPDLEKTAITAASPATSASASSWPQDDPATVNGYRILFKDVDGKPGTKDWTRQRVPVLKDWLKTHAPDYIRGNGKAKKQDLEDMIYKIICHYPVPGDRRWDPKSTPRKHQNGVYEFILSQSKQGEEAKQAALFNQSMQNIGLNSGMQMRV